jgi:hypothetical protein
MDPLKTVHQETKVKVDELLRELEQYPAVKREMERIMQQYGVPILSATYGARWKEDLLRDVYDILFTRIPSHPVEVKIYPEDPDGYHWAVEYHVLKWDDGKGYVRAIEYEQEKGGEDRE